MSPQSAATQRRAVTIPAPELDNAATLLRAASGKLHDDHKIVSTSVRLAIARLCEDVAAELDRAPDLELSAPYSDVDGQLLDLAHCLDAGLARRISQLVSADAVAHRVIAAEHRAQRAEDLAAELRRHLRSLERLLERARAEAAAQ